ncbi:hypothetical protein CEXT_177871 [Caerostris extrusa]|uniref:Uncharacterized protein n=1 Tax=Caerostris extrusa TaxID=172846 RepID=A0AAV4WA27_CAEEX|nr:hypothetical protein CEXT_177871 [Caerostris extrusa]
MTQRIKKKEPAECVSGPQIVSSANCFPTVGLPDPRFIEMSISGDEIQQERVSKAAITSLQSFVGERLTGNHGPISGHDVASNQMVLFRFGTQFSPGNRNQDRNC